ncbi:hypothetical protein [Granulicella aggregans]|uniref:hypothetical protein n=1 Tax=Granulicella aggregans TaxID=474949 RepID=UPI001C84A887|nr:hypothetical protein [Granulicella aggregans]
MEADDYGLGADERTGRTAYRGCDGSSGWQAYRGFCGDRAGGEREAGYHFPDGRIEVRWKGVSLPYRIFSKDQRVSHTAVVENKRLGHALSLIRAAQKVKHEPKVQTNSEKLGYKKHPRKVYGPDYEEPSAPPAKTVEMTA